MSSGWSTDFGAAPADTQLWVYATDDQGYAYGLAFIWEQGNPGAVGLFWQDSMREVNDGIERALMWHRMPERPGKAALDGALAAIRRHSNE